MKEKMKMNMSEKENEIENENENRNENQYERKIENEPKTEHGMEIIRANIKKLSDWKNILELVPSKFKKTDKLKKTGLAGLFAASLELTREGLVKMMQKKDFGKLLIKEKK